MKKAFSLMLALAMVFALVLIAAPEAEAATCDHGNHEGWTEWSATNPPSNDQLDLLESGNFYLTSDLTITCRIRIKVGHTVSICLNGYKLTVNPTNSEGQPEALGCFDSNNGEEANPIVLNIYDCSANKTGVVERTTMPEAGRFGAMALARKYVTINIYGGTWKLLAQNNSATSPSMFQTNANTAVINVYEDAKFEQVNGMTFKITGTLNVHGAGSNISIQPSGSSFHIFIDGVEKTDAVDLQTFDVAAFGAPSEPSTPSTPSSPSTGDVNVALMVAGLVVGLCGIAAVAFLPKKETV